MDWIKPTTNGSFWKTKRKGFIKDEEIKLVSNDSTTILENYIPVSERCSDCQMQWLMDAVTCSDFRMQWLSDAVFDGFHDCPVQWHSTHSAIHLF